MKRIVYLILLLPFFVLYSCVQNEEDIFSASPSERMYKAVTEYKTLLASATNGWLADYYPEKDHSIGGYAVYCKFSVNGKVDVSCEINTNVPAHQIETSDWDVIAEQGPVLAFTSYNKVMHYFCEPYASDVDGRMGDYEFVIMQVVSQDEIVLKGKKHGNKMVLRRNSANVDPANYFSEVAALEDKVSEFGTLGLILNGDTIGVAPIVDRTINLGYTEKNDDGKEESKTEKISYAFTPKGIRLYEPFTFRDVTMQNFEWDAVNEKYVCTDAGVNAVLISYFPPDYQLRYGEILGKWQMRYHGASTSVWETAEVEIKLKKKNATFTLSCDDIFSFPGIELSYDGQKGIISILNQNAAIQEETGYFIRVCAYDRAAGYLNTSSTGPIGIRGVWNNDEGGVRSIHFVDNGTWGTYRPNGFLLRLFNSSNTSMGNFTANKTDYRFNDITITKLPD